MATPTRSTTSAAAAATPSTPPFSPLAAVPETQFVAQLSRLLQGHGQRQGHENTSTQAWLSDEWQSYVDRLVYAAKKGQVSDYCPRGIVWRLLLNILPVNCNPTLWKEILQRNRSEYTQLKSRTMPDFSRISGAVDPLSAREGQWNEFYKNVELKNEICTDLERLYPNGCEDYFMSNERQQILCSVLFVWSRQNARVSYRQGMHELLAPFLLVLQNDCACFATAVTKHNLEVSLTTETCACVLHTWEETLDVIFDPKFLEHDIYSLFENIMRDVAHVYTHTIPAAHTYATDPPPPVSDVAALSERVQTVALMEIDEILALHMAAEGVSAHLYGIKWARLLFCREFHIEDVLVLWDYMFAHVSSDVSLIKMLESLMCTLLYYVRDSLLASDNTGILQRLMHYPPVHNVRDIITLCDEIRQDPDSLRRHGSMTKLESTDTPSTPLPEDHPLAVRGVSTHIHAHFSTSSHGRAMSQPTSNVSATNSSDKRTHLSTLTIRRKDEPSTLSLNDDKGFLTKVSQTVAGAASLLNPLRSPKPGQRQEIPDLAQGVALRLEALAHGLIGGELSNAECAHRMLKLVETLRMDAHSLTVYDNMFPSQLEFIHPLQEVHVKDSEILQEMNSL